jgi:lysophospholipase L1-like esterase
METLMKLAFPKTRLLALALVLATSSALPLAHAQDQAQTRAQAHAPKQSASEAFQKQDAGVFLKKHESFLVRGKSGPIGLLFLGDSITERWHIAPHIWEAYYGKYQPANFGIGGDRTQHLIWQIEHGELDGLSPKVTVLMIGTNNSLDYNAEEIAAADRKIVAMIRARLPETKILVLGVFPRGPRDTKGNPITQAHIDEAARRMQTIDAVNRDLARLDDGKTIRFLNINPVFLGQDGRIPHSIMPDQLHPGAAGYQLWADAMQPLLESMLK